jgi:hypothetical protein
MAGTNSSKFQKALDVVESLPDIQQQHLMEVVLHRLVETRRAELAQSIREAKAEYRTGKVKTGSISDLLKELNSCAD